MINPFTHRKILKKGTPGRARIHSMSMRDGSAANQNVRMTLQVFVEGMNPYEVEDQWIVSNKVSLGFGMEMPVRVDPGNPQKVAIDWDGVQSEYSAETAARREALAAQGPVPAAPGSVAGVSDPLAGGLAALGGQSVTPTIDMRNDPELRGKLEQILGRKLEPGTTETLDVSGNPALAAQIMQVVQQHAAEKAGQAPAAQQQAGGGDALDKLERLAKLRDSGALTDAEFESEKKQLLGEI